MAQAIEAPPGPDDVRLAMTYEEWRAWPEGEGKQSEWVDGEVIVFMPPTILHAQLSGFLTFLLSAFGRARRLGQVLAAPVEMRLSPTVSREPDILFVSHEHRDRVTEKRIEGAADLVVELISDGSVRRDRLQKFAEYALAGVPEYWLLDPRPGRQREEFFRLTDEGVYEPVPPDADGRYHAAVLPGFWLRPEWLRHDPLPDPLACLSEIAPDVLAGGSGERRVSGA